jgi:hypothetical protein
MGDIAQLRRSTPLQNVSMSVGTEYDMVVLKIGNAEMSMPYEQALKLSQWLRVRAKQAKKFAGDTSRHWSVIGTASYYEE